MSATSTVAKESQVLPSNAATITAGVLVTFHKCLLAMGVSLRAAYTACHMILEGGVEEPKTELLAGGLISNPRLKAEEQATLQPTYL